MAKANTPGKAFWIELQEQLRAFERGPVVVTRERIVIWNVTAEGKFVGDMTADLFFAQARKVLKDSGVVCCHGDNVVLEDDRQLVVLGGPHGAEPGAVNRLASLIAVGVRGEESSSQAIVPAKLVGALLADPDLRRELPKIEYYARRLTFDRNFNLCRPGWNPGTGILIHADDVEPQPFTPAAAAAGVERLPPALRALLGEFCWATEADLANAVAAMLTGLLVNHFIDDPHPVVLLDGNQPGIGKTLLVQAIGRALDGVEPTRTPLCHDEELAKRLCTQLREARSSLVFLDNVRGRIDSPLLESNIPAAELSFRLLGHNLNVTRPNTYLWVITSNGTAATGDLVSRGLPVRLHYEGDPEARKFSVSPLEYATENRPQLLAELAGMVVRWREAGQPLAEPKSRCARWSRVIGGILQVAGLPGFLANLQEARAAMDEDLQALAALAEHAVANRLQDFYSVVGATGPAGVGAGRPPRDWLGLFIPADVFQDRLAQLNEKGRQTLAGQFLARKVDRPVPVTTEQGGGMATLRKSPCRSNQKRYHFEVVLQPDGAAPAPAGASTSSLSTVAALLRDPPSESPPAPPTSTSPVTTTVSVKEGGAGSDVRPTPAGDPLVGEARASAAPSAATPGGGNNLDWF
jgi:hypothetical protein